MGKSLIDRWIEALESGDYAQCEGGLHKDNGYCCLGVLVELEYGPDVWFDLTEPNDQKYYAYRNGDWDVRCDYPDDNLLEETGLDKFGLEAGELATMNDEGKSFAEIAAYIREKIAEHQSAT